MPDHDIEAMAPVVSDRIDGLARANAKIRWTTPDPDEEPTQMRYTNALASQAAITATMGLLQTIEDSVKSYIEDTDDRDIRLTSVKHLIYHAYGLLEGVPAEA